MYIYRDLKDINQIVYVTIYRVRQIPFLLENALKKLLNIFSNFFFYLKVHSFRLITENNFIQMAASAGHAVAYTISPIFKHIIDCVLLYFTNTKTGRKTSSIASTVRHAAPSCWNQILPISSSSIFANKNSFNMAR